MMVEIINVNGKKENRELSVNIDDDSFKKVNRKDNYFTEVNDDGSVSFFYVQKVGVETAFRNGLWIREAYVFYKDDIKVNKACHERTMNKRLIFSNLGNYSIVDELVKLYDNKYFCHGFNKYIAFSEKTILLFVNICLKAQNTNKLYLKPICDYSEIPCESIQKLGRLKSVLNSSYIQKIDDEKAVARIFYGYEDKVKEHSRIYIGEHKTVFCYKTIFGWIEEKDVCVDEFNFAIGGKDDLSGTRAGYCFDFDSEKFCLSVYAKGLENLVKMDYENILKYFLDTGDYFNLNDKILDFSFAEPHKYANSFAEMCNIPQYLLQSIDDYLENSDDVDNIIWCLNRCPIGVDVETFEEVLKLTEKVKYKHSAYMLSTIEDIIEYFNVNLITVLKYLIMDLSSGDGAFYTDYIESVISYHLRQLGFVWNPDDIDEAHDRATEYINLLNEDEEINTYSKAFEEQRSYWTEYEFVGKNYSVIAPKNIHDIFVEGSKLHHCVRTYIENISLGKTIILFIRRNDDITTPFYTLEVKSGAVRQCHGICNSDMTDDVKKFLSNYCKNKKIIDISVNKALTAN